MTTSKRLSIALYEPDIPQNTGTILRLCACLGIEAHLIEPAGFPITDRAFRRAGMDYLDRVTIRRHASWDAFDLWRRSEGLRIALFTTGADVCYLDHEYEERDVLLFGREVGRRSGPGRGRGRSETADPDAGGVALPECRDGRRDGGG